VLKREIKNLFASPLYIFDLNEECEGLTQMVAMDGQNFSDRTNKLLAEDPNFNINSNQFLDHPGYGTTKLKELLHKAVDEIAQDRNWPNYRLEYESRHNSYNPLDSDSPHFHFMTDLVGVFYLDMPEDSGDILFFETRGAVSFCWTDPYISTDRHGRQGRVYHRHTPKAGQLIMFPNYLFHTVETNLSNTHRISVVFDIKVIPDEI
jgi:uncharacterized protein (TIGR02466 family)